MKKALFVLTIVIVAGCATHANIEMPVVTQVHDKIYENKSLAYEIMYSQPEPGIFSGGEQQALKPLKQAKLSVASAATLKRLPDFIFQQLPSNVTRADPGNSDLKLLVELYAHHKKGPTYADFEAGKSFGKSLLTLGLGSSEYNIMADFDVTYKLYKADKEVFKKHYKIKESVDHERGKLEGYNGVHEFAGQLLEKHLILTLNNFFIEAVANIEGVHNSVSVESGQTLMWLSRRPGK